jgi:hypothetical protein
MDQLDYNLLFRLFLGLSLDAAVSVTVFTKNGDWLIAGDIGRRLMAAVRNWGPVTALPSGDHSLVGAR